MKKTILLPLLVLSLTCSAQTKPKNTKIYYVPFTEQQYQILLTRSVHADSLLAQSKGLAFEIMPAVGLIQEMLSVFAGAYMRGDTLQMVPLKQKDSVKRDSVKKGGNGR